MQRNSLEGAGLNLGFGCGKKGMNEDVEIVGDHEA